MRKQLARTSAIATAMATLVGLVGCAQAGGGGNDNTVEVGVSSVFSGPVANYGQDTMKGAQLAIAQLAKTTPGVKFKLVSTDDQCSPAGGVAAFRKLTDVDNVDVILGSACSSSTLTGMPTLLKSRVPALTFGSTNASISQQSGVGGNKYMWRMNLDDSIMGTYWIKYIAGLGVRRVAILAANNDFGRGATDLYKKQLPGAGIQVADTEYYTVGASDLRPQLTKIAAANAQGFITFAEPADCGQMLRQMHEMGLKLQMYSRGGCATAEGIKATGDPSLANGVREASYWAPTDTQKEFLDAYRAKYGAGIPGYNVALAYYGMLTLGAAAKAGGTNAAGIEKGLAKVNLQTGIGPISFDSHDQAHPNLFILKVVNGQITVLQTIGTGK